MGAASGRPRLVPPGQAAVDRRGWRNLWCLSIRSRHLQDLVRTAVSLPGPTIEVALWRRGAAVAALSENPPVDAASSSDRDRGAVDLSELRAAVAALLNALSRRLDDGLPDALKAAPQAWDRVDDLLTIFDPPLTALLADLRRRLEAAASLGTDAATRAVALEGLLVMEAACGLARLCERRLSSLIRLRVRSGEDDLLPGGRPFLDMAAALKEAARAWA